jgi:hypothetical protein
MQLPAKSRVVARDRYRHGAGANLQESINTGALMTTYRCRTLESNTSHNETPAGALGVN